MIQIENARDLEDGTAFEGARVVGVTGGTSTPIEDLEKVAERIYALAGTATAREAAPTLAHAALTAVAEPAYRSSSLDENGRPRRSVVAGAA